MPSAVVPAAGSATRFGGGKLFAPVDGEPLLDRTIAALLDAGLDDVVVVTPADAGWGSGVSRLKDARVRVLVNPDPSRGMFSSVQIGVRDAAPGPVAILPGDMPFVRAETVRRLSEAAARTTGVVSPRHEGRRGHPVFVPDDLRDAVLAAPATAMLNEVLRPFHDRFVDIDVADRGVLRDVDVVEDLRT